MATKILLTPFTPKVMLDGEVNAPVRRSTLKSGKEWLKNGINSLYGNN